MKRFAGSVVLAVTMLLVPVSSNATLITLSGILSGANESPVVLTPATGFAQVTLDTVAQTLHIVLSFSGLTSNTTAAHIHCCVPLGGNAGVATTVPAFPGFPLGVTSGTYDGVLNLASAASYNPAFITANGGSVAQAEAVFIAGLLSNQTYLNTHTVNFPGGEIRAFLRVPEPATLVLFGIALAGVAFTRRPRP